MDQMFTVIPHRRPSPVGPALSVGLHLAVVIGAVSVIQAGVPELPKRSITFLMSAATLPDMPAMSGEPLRTATVEQPVRPEPPPVADPQPTRADMQETAPPPPAVAVLSEPAQPEPEPARALPPVVSPPRDRGADTAASVSVGAFDRSPSRVTHRAAGAVATAGFDIASKAVAEASGGGAVRSGGFDLRQAQPAPAGVSAPQPVRIDTPVEILFKPVPGYTEEAKALKIEGSVVLEVEFAATSDVRVLRVLSGLGHGLDEAAARAAGQIRFKPARSAGGAVDFRTTVHIVFRLT